MAVVVVKAMLVLFGAKAHNKNKLTNKLQGSLSYMRISILLFGLLGFYHFCGLVPSELRLVVIV